MKKLAAALALTGLAHGAMAQNLRPGLWEITNRVSSESGKMESAMQQMQQQMAAMPPEQRKMMQDAMARQGMAMGPAGAVRMCFTKEMVERNEVPAQQGDCRTTLQPRSGNTVKMSFTCTTPPSSGEGQITFASPEAYSVKMAMTTTAQGKSEKMNMDASGKWLGADCGAVKPAAPRR